MPEGERKGHLPDWARKERASDLAWIGENLHVLWPAARLGYEQFGRGALTVDTTSEPVPGLGNPMWYLTQEQVGALGGADEIRMVSVYDPSWELVTILLKSEERMSSYRIGVPSVRSK
jgi:hypothetical protein